jgi:poly-gamma-glutamate synthesis protein (capsule biosynthesis protein)
VIKDGNIRTHLYPVKQNKQSSQILISNGEEKDRTLERIHSFNNIINDEKKVFNEWNSYLNENSNNYLNYWSPLSYVNNRYIKSILRRLNFNFYNKKTLSLFLNLIRCEAHADMSKGIIKRYIKK